MKKEEKLNLVKQAYEGYLEMADYNENSEIIKIDLDGFDYTDECKNDNGEVDIDLVSELNEMLINYFKGDGYIIYTDFYPFEGQFNKVSADTVIAIKEG